jgi:hypothetical protein
MSLVRDCTWHKDFPAMMPLNPNNPYEVRCPSCSRTLDTDLCAGCSWVILRIDSLLGDGDDEYAAPTVRDGEVLCVRCARA